MRRRFFVEHFNGTSAVVEGDTAHHLGRVLRAQAGQLYELSDGASAWLGRIELVARDRVEFALLEELPAPQIALDLTLLLSIVKFDAFEWALEKSTELGVSTIVPVASARSEKSLIAAAAKRAARWRKILLESSQQSRRLQVPHLASVITASEAFAAQRDKFCLMLSERPEAASLHKVLQNVKGARAAAIAIGPEGGWIEEELSSARSSGFREASLGSLILRTETAVISALSIINFALSPE